MFANDWSEIPDNDDHLPFEERGWVKRLREQTAAGERFDRLFPDFAAKMGRACAEEMTRVAIEVLMGEN